MNNDELAMLIKQGNFEYLPQLWKNTEFLLYNILRYIIIRCRIISL